MVEFVSYDGSYPNLCSGRLVLKIDGEIFDTGDLGPGEYCSLNSGGSVWFDEGWMEHVEYGDWSISGLPEKFAHLKDDIEDVINDNIPSGCCGGCI